MCSKCCATVLKPVTVVWDKITANATRRVNVAEGPLAAHIAKHKAGGTDLTEAVFWEYIQAQQLLFRGRLAQLKLEWATLRQGGTQISWVTLGPKDILSFLRFWVIRPLFVYMAAVMVGRWSMYPLLQPGSPFIKSLKYHNPNFAPSLDH